MTTVKQGRPTAEDYAAARKALAAIDVVGATLAECRHRKIVDIVWPIAFSAGWNAAEESIEEETAR